MKVSKHIFLDGRAKREIRKFPKQVRNKIRAYAEILTETGKLQEPFAKKLSSQPA